MNSQKSDENYSELEIKQYEFRFETFPLTSQYDPNTQSPYWSKNAEGQSRAILISSKPKFINSELLFPIFNGYVPKQPLK